MRVLFIGYYYPFVGGGISRIQDIIQVLSEKQIEVSILSPKTLSTRKAKWVETSDGIYILRFLAVSPLKVPIIGGLFSILSAFFGFLLLYLLKRPEVIVSTLPPGDPPLGAFIACKLLKKPMVFDVRDEWEDIAINRDSALARLWYIVIKNLYNVVYNDALFCTAVTPTLVNHLMKRGVKRVHLLPHGVVTSLFMPRDKTETRIALGLNPTDFTIVYSGILEEYYRIDIVVKALRKLIFEKGIKDLKLLIIGSGSRMEDYLRMVEELNLSKNVYFVGLKPREKVAEFLGCSDIGVIPYDDNPLWLYPLPIKFYEYCSSGLPVIVSVVGGAILIRYVEKLEVGLTIEPLNVDKMAEAIEFFYQHREKAEQMGLKARIVALNHFGREKIALRLLKLLSRHIRPT